MSKILDGMVDDAHKLLDGKVSFGPQNELIITPPTAEEITQARKLAAKALLADRLSGPSSEMTFTKRK